MSLETLNFEDKRAIILQQLNSISSTLPTIVAVTKKQPDNRVDSALVAGHRVFGENRIQEATQRWANRRRKFNDLKLHFIGPLQTNKVDAAVSLFDVIESLDRPKLALALSKALQKSSRTPSLLIQVNTGEEIQKSGISPTELSDFYHYCKDDLNLPVRGLMCIPPANQPPAPHFALISKLADRFNLEMKSMGMSNDFEIATQLGATHIRIGTGLFGSRLPQ